MRILECGLGQLPRPIFQRSIVCASCSRDQQYQSGCRDRHHTSRPAGVPLADPQFEIEPGAIYVYTFPRLDIDGTGIFDRAFQIRSTWPVIVYQFNPLNNEGVASNDASLLLPTEGLGREYIAMSWPTSPIPCIDGQPGDCLPHQHGYVTIVATSPGNTTVQVTPTAPVSAGGDIDQLEAGIEHQFMLRQGQVLNLQAHVEEVGNIDEIIPLCEVDEDCNNGACTFGVCLEDFGDQPAFTVSDLTGSIINASQAVAVFGGHEEAVVGQGAVPNISNNNCSLYRHGGSDFSQPGLNLERGSIEVWRIVAAQDGTIINTIPLNRRVDKSCSIGAIFIKSSVKRHLRLQPTPPSWLPSTWQVKRQPVQIQVTPP